ncbi:MAG: TAT-variant-translocated molybdopterin oxidoreductase [Bryobacteraceae bacterium]|nr:TAT-variant-translocated molybdopterin oxidoreductase [Bryobacteraceae bacterium]
MSLIQIGQAGGTLTGRRYWRSLEELADTPNFREWLHREFPENASEMLESRSRRTLLKLMAASIGLAGLTACRRPVEKILPASRGVEDYIPGNPLYYATAMELGGAAAGLMVEAHDGRPTKIEGNPKHPDSRGACSAYAQASVLGLYDPDRSQHVARGGRKSDWEEFARFAKEHFTGDGKGVWLLSGYFASPSFEAVRGHFSRKFPGARWVEYEALGRESIERGAELAFGERVETHYDFEKADVILALDSDFLGVDSPGLNAVRGFARRRHVESVKDAPNRLYVAESRFSTTGAMADHRFRVRSGEIAEAAAELAAAVGLRPGNEPRRAWVAEVAKDLAAHRGRSIVIAGRGQSAEAHALVHAINEALGNFGQTVNFTAPARQAGGASLGELAEALSAGEVKTLVILGSNPVFTAPADLNFAANLEKAGVTIHLGLEVDETAARSEWHLPQAHYLEAWGDVRALDGTASVQQPLIEPLYGGRTAAEVLALIGGYPHERAYDIARGFWTARWPAAEAERNWRRALHEGVVEGTRAARITPKTRPQAWSGAEVERGGIEVTFYQSPAVYDGRFANNAWLQELPDAMTKLAWDNAALMSPATAKSLGVANGDLVLVAKGARQAELPAWIMPGQVDGSIAVALGYGRTECGRVGQGVGHNAYPIRTSDGPGFASGYEVRKTGRSYSLVSAQEHHSMEGRPLVREATVDEYRHDPEFAKHAVHHGPAESLYKNLTFDEGYQWGMAIDLNRCVGCNACVTACQAENNIPVVGKQQLERGREMHWIRVDRYFTGSEAAPEAAFQPVACQHCENAPCENVCPVAATAHSSEGLNEMAYNRCVGTRYCSNNCPYKVRRFNFLEWHKDVAESTRMVFNPDVTVRMRGVMEKCTYCVQRIQETKIRAKAEGRRAIRDGEILTACQQTCPAEAIVFGNLNDPNSRVSRLKKLDRDYAMLAELNVKPRTSYLARLRNPNPEISRIDG